MRLKAKLMQNAVLSKTVELLHPFFPLWSPITWDLLKHAFLEEVALVQACGHPEMENLHPLIFASSASHLTVITTCFSSHLTLPVCSSQPQHPPLPSYAWPESPLWQSTFIA